MVPEDVVELAGDAEALGRAASVDRELARREELPVRQSELRVRFARPAHQVRGEHGEGLQPGEGERIREPDGKRDRVLGMVEGERHHHEPEGRGLRGDPGDHAFEAQDLRGLPRHEDERQAPEVGRPPPIDEHDGHAGDRQKREHGPAAFRPLPPRQSGGGDAGDEPHDPDPQAIVGKEVALLRVLGEHGHADHPPGEEARDAEGARDAHARNSRGIAGRGNRIERYRRGMCLRVLGGGVLGGQDPDPTEEDAWHRFSPSPL